MKMKNEETIKNFLLYTAKTASLSPGATKEDISSLFADLRVDLTIQSSEMYQALMSTLTMSDDEKKLSSLPIEVFDKYNLNDETVHAMIEGFGKGNHVAKIEERMSYLFEDLETLHYVKTVGQLNSKLNNPDLSSGEKDKIEAELLKIEDITGMDSGVLSQEADRIEGLFAYEIQAKNIDIDSLLGDASDDISGENNIPAPK